MTTDGPDLSALAMDMLKWERMKRALDELEQAIKDTVMQLGKTQTVGNVRATYSKGRKTYNYEAAADGHPAVTDATIVLFTERKINWKDICEHVGIKDVPIEKQSPPSVSLKLLEG
jgi:hypothetical protein